MILAAKMKRAEQVVVHLPALSTTSAVKEQNVMSDGDSICTSTEKPAKRRRNTQHHLDCWEVDWSHAGNTGTEVLARNPKAHRKSAREWHMVTTGLLRKAGITTPTYRKDSWEVDWSKRNGKLVWARNVSSKMPGARDWHWVDYHQLERSGIAWKPANEAAGRRIDTKGYVILSRRGMTNAEIKVAEKFGIFRGRKKEFCREHHLVAVVKFQQPLTGMVVRHLNGNKSDNRPENIAIGTVKDNSMDHHEALRQMMRFKSILLQIIQMKNLAEVRRVVEEALRADKAA